MSDFVIDSGPEVTLSAQRQRRKHRMTSRSRRLGLGSAGDHGAEILKAMEAVKLSQAFTDIVPLPVLENDGDMSAQRQRRADRMATRRQRLKLGPVSEHRADIAQALHKVTTDPITRSSTSAQDSLTIMDKYGATPSLTDGILARETKSSTCNVEILGRT